MQSVIIHVIHVICSRATIVVIFLINGVANCRQHRNLLPVSVPIGEALLNVTRFWLNKITPSHHTIYLQTNKLFPLMNNKKRNYLVYLEILGFKPVMKVLYFFYIYGSSLQVTYIYIS